MAIRAKNSPSDSEPAGKKSRKPALPQSDVPTRSLSEALRVPRAIAEHLAKEPSTPLQVAKALGMQPTTGPFRAITSSSVADGLTDGAAWAERISLGDLGRRIVAPTEEASTAEAMRNAAMRPRVTRLFLEKYNGSKWPRADIGRNVLEEMGVPTEQSERALALIKADAEFIGALTDINGAVFVDFGGVPTDERTLPGAAAPLATVTPISASGSDLRDGANGERTENPQSDVEVATSNDRVFVTHGTNRDIVGQIKEILTFGKFQPIVSVERESVSKPVPDKVLDDMRSCFAGIVHVGAEKHLLDDKGEVRVRPKRQRPDRDRGGYGAVWPPVHSSCRERRQFA